MLTRRNCQPEVYLIFNILEFGARSPQYLNNNNSTKDSTAVGLWIQ